MSNYLEQALGMAGRGIHIAFIETGTKACRQLGWEELSTTSAEQIIAMAKAKPGWTNYACVAKAIEGGVFIFDDDSGGAIRDEYESLGGVLQATLKVRTWSGKYHYYFKHSARSLAYQKRINKAYISEKKQGAKGELWSLRMHNSYGVGPGSVVIEDGKTGEYTIAWDAEIIEIPDAFLDFLITRYEAAQVDSNAKTKESSALAVVSSIEPNQEGTETAEPKAWKKPKGRKAWIKELNSNETIGEGERNTVLISIAGHLRHNLKFEESLIDSTLQSMNARRCRPQLTIQEVTVIAHSEAKYDNKEKREEAKAEGRSVEEVRQLVKLALYSTATEKKESGWDIPENEKEATNFATALIYEHLKTLGKFYFADSTGYLLLKGQEDRLIQISSEDSYFANMLEGYGIFAGQAEAVKVGKHINVKAEVEGTPATVHYSSHYNSKTKCFYFAERAGWLIRGDGEKLERVPNGSDGELFAFKKQVKDKDPFGIDLNNLPTIKNSLIPDENSLMTKLFFKDLVFKPSIMTVQEKLVLLTTYVVLLVLMEIADDKPMIQMIGDSQTGKTFVLDKIGRAIVGTDFKVQPLPRSAEAFENVMINNDLAFFDNVNAVDPAIASLICMAVTGCKIVRRELFTTRKQLEVPSKVTLGISALTSVLPTTEQANRSLTINLLRRPRKSNVSKKILLAEFDVEREALVSEMIVRAQMVLKALKTQEGYRPAFDTRLADVATLILKVARHEGWEDAALNLLKTWDDEQQDEALKEDDLSSCLAEFLYKPGWVSRVYHAGELNAAMKPLNANPNDVSWKWSPVSLSSKLRKSAESYGRRFGLKIGEDEHTKTATFTFDPPDRIETTEAKGENTVNIDSKEPIAPEWDNDPSSRPIEWERGKPIFVKPGDSPHGEGYLRPSDIACIPAELPAEVKEGIIFWSRTLVHGGWEGVFDYTPTEAVMMFCTHYGDEKPDLEGWRAAFTRIKGINDGGAGKAIEEAALPTSLETNQEAVKTEKGQESIRYWGGACGVKAQITDFVIKIPL